MLQYRTDGDSEAFCWDGISHWEARRWFYKWKARPLAQTIVHNPTEKSLIVEVVQADGSVVQLIIDPGDWVFRNGLQMVAMTAAEYAEQFDCRPDEFG